MPALLAVDPGSATGWALAADGKTVRAWDTLVLRGKGGRPGRLLCLERHLDALHAESPIGLVAFELPYVGQFPAIALSLGRMVGVVEVWAARLGLECRGYEPSEIKNAVGLGGRAKKEQMIARVRQLGYPVMDEHQADAVACALLALSGAMPAERRRKQALVKLRKAPDLFTAKRRKVA